MPFIVKLAGELYAATIGKPYFTVEEPNQAYCADIYLHIIYRLRPATSPTAAPIAIGRYCNALTSR